MDTEKYSGARNIFKVLGPLCLLIAFLLIASAVVGFMKPMSIDQAFNGGPDHFINFFIAMPFFIGGAIMTNLGYMRTAASYTAREMAPVAKDTFNYIAKEAQPGIRNIASAIKGDNIEKVTCQNCQTLNDADAKFCNECGETLKMSCPKCGSQNDADAKFCDQCGERLN